MKTARRFARRCRQSNPERRTFGVRMLQLQQRIKPCGGIRLACTRATGDEHHLAAQADFAGLTLPIGFALYWREQARKPFFLQSVLCRGPLLARAGAAQEVLCHALLAIPEAAQVKPTMAPNQRGHCSTPCGQQLRRSVHQPVFVPSGVGGGERGPPGAQFCQGFRLETEQLTAASNEFMKRQATVPPSFQLRQQRRGQQQGQRCGGRQCTSLRRTLARQRCHETCKGYVQAPQPAAFPPAFQPSQHGLRFGIQPGGIHGPFPTAGKRRSSASSTSQGGVMVAQPWAVPAVPRKNIYTAPPNCSCGR